MADNDGLVESLRRLVKGELNNVNTSIDCVIVNYNNGRADVRSIPQQMFIDGDTQPYPIIFGVRVVWPRFAGGMAGVKGPVTVGDKCLLIVCQQAIDGSDDMRRFDITDSYCIVGAFDSDDVAGNDDMRLYFGGAYLAITKDGKIVMNAPAGIEQKSPMTTFSENIKVNGTGMIGGVTFNTHRHKENGDGGGITDGPQ